MNRSMITLASTLALITSAAGAAPRSETILLAESEQGQPLTLMSARQRVSGWLDASGQRQLRAGHAEFDRDGNVTVDVTTLTGLAIQHVVVNKATGLVAVAQAGRKVARAAD